MALADIKVSVTNTEEFKELTGKFLCVAKCLQEYVDMHIDDEDQEHELREKSRKALCDLTGEKFEPEPHVAVCRDCYFVHVKSDTCPNCGEHQP